MRTTTIKNHRRALLNTLIVSGLSLLSCDLIAEPLRVTAKQSDGLVREIRNIILPELSERAVRGYLATQMEQRYRGKSLDSLVLIDHHKSLLAEHFTFQNTVNNLPVYRSTLSVSVDQKTNQVLKVYDTGSRWFGYSQANLYHDTIAERSSLDAAWNILPATKLLSQPSTELYYLPRGEQLVLAYLAQLEVDNPFGSWDVWVDAKTGKVLSKQQRSEPLKRSIALANEPTKNRAQLSIKQRVKPRSITKSVSLQRAIDQLNSRTKPAKTDVAMKAMADGSALVFDPDPRTTLNDATLSQSSDASLFRNAYQTVTLRDLTIDGFDYQLSGPWVSVIDFDAPLTRPSTTLDGNWDAQRGELAFTDVMTYFHLDQSQRYIQSLGFDGANGIQQGPIEVDTNGASGADNSYFLPGSNQLSFGHGGVPDNEDADVILHEYGHAIHFSINSNWGGGDSGAIGEGFGDYWAGSYSYAAPNGQTFNPNWVYSWDGHNEFWPGRVMDRTDYRYDPNTTYTAHMAVNNLADYADELWSTPLFQAHRELVDAGVDRREVDQIILEAQFGLGANITMPIMAESIVATAQRLQPTGDHADVFYRWFNQMNILSAGLELDDVIITSAGNDLIAEPGEQIEFNLPLTNNGLFDVAISSAVVSSNDVAVNFVTASGSYPQIAMGGTETNSASFVADLSNELVCGAPVNMQLNLEYTLEGETVAQNESFDFAIATGSKQVISETSMLETVIPDNDPNGITSSITVSGGGQVVDENFTVDVNISHSWRGDLLISLRSPSGTEVVLFDGDPNDQTIDLVGNFPGDFTVVGNLDDFTGESFDGEWQLVVADRAELDTGQINSWSLSLSGEATCKTVSAGSDSDDDNSDLVLALALIVVFGGSINPWMLLPIILLVRRRNRR
ncbi:MAG: proprotein convertase P-domain-containing protein [Kangiellaceae bacterium]|jgi:subtilisin-like proprotein convertase family protein|nr:proprotein convertase P-domain-containing protein [Kangiellaceae bacterium]